ncbi:hypothetical protein Droror1_Dr00004633 [Drosera rotundifolia]
MGTFSRPYVHSQGHFGVVGPTQLFCCFTLRYSIRFAGICCQRVFQGRDDDKQVGGIKTRSEYDDLSVNGNLSNAIVAALVFDSLIFFLSLMGRTLMFIRV